MKKLILLSAFVGMAMVLSCTKEGVETSETPKTVIKVGIEDSKTTIGESEAGKRKIYWANSDKIQANEFTSNPLSEIGDKQTSASFVFEGILSAPYKVLYPAEYFKSDGVVTLPALQDTTVSVIPMCGYSESTLSVNLTVVTTALQISLKQGTDTDNIKCIELSSDTQPLSGDFSIDYQTGALSSSASAADCKLRLEKNCALSTEEASVFVVSVPSGTYNLTVKVKDVNSHCMTKTLTGKTFTAGNYVTLPELTFTPTTTEFDVNIATAEQWNAFAKDYNEDKFGYDPSVSIEADLDFTDTTVICLTKTFNGMIDGNEYSFKNIQLTNQALVGKLASDGVIKNLKIDSGSKLTVTTDGEETYYAPLVADHQGLLDHCESAADMDFVASHDAKETWFIGGLAGRVRSGSIKNCKVSGTLKNTEVATLTVYSYIGGITSDVNKYADGDDGEVANCEFSGKILLGPDAGSSETGVTGITCKNTTGFRIGGIVARAQNGTVSSCTTTSDAEIDVRGDILVLYLGGIVGNAQAEIFGCENSAKLSVWSSNTDASGGNAQVGGIAGSSSVKISYSKNAGSINMYGQHRNSSYGGIVGKNTGTLTGCSNSGTLTESTYRPRYLYIGGVTGWNTSAGTITDVHNTGNVTVGNVPNNSDMGKTACGGVIGYNEADIDGSKIDNSGTVTVNITKTSYLFVSAGGIIGANFASLSGAKNKGKVLSTCSSAVSTSSAAPFFTAFGGIIGSQQNGATAATISGCVNDRGSESATTQFIYANITSSTASTCLNWCEGGIIGYAYESNLTVAKCTNNAYVCHQANAAKTANRTSFTGGIIGRISATTQQTKVSECTNKGRCQSSNYNNSLLISNGPFMGGIVGAAEGASGKLVTIEKCENSNESGAAADDVYMYILRGTLGGVAGYASYVDMKNCNVSKKISGNANATYFGGMVGLSYNTSIVGGTMSSEMSLTKLEGSNNIGGIVSLLGAGSSVNGSKYAGSITKAKVKYGAVAALSEAGTTITNAVIASSAKVMEVAASTDDSYVCGDSNATISGTKIE